MSVYSQSSVLAAVCRCVNQAPSVCRLYANSTTSCCSTDSERPQRCCHLWNNFGSRRICLILHTSSQSAGRCPQNCPRLLIHGFLVTPEPLPKRHLDRFSLCSTAHGCNKRTQTYTQRPRYICSNWPRLCTECMRCGLKYSEDKKRENEAVAVV